MSSSAIMQHLLLNKDFFYMQQKSEISASALMSYGFNMNSIASNYLVHDFYFLFLPLQISYASRILHDARRS